LASCFGFSIFVVFVVFLVVVVENKSLNKKAHNAVKGKGIK